MRVTYSFKTTYLRQCVLSVIEVYSNLYVLLNKIGAREGKLSTLTVFSCHVKCRKIMQDEILSKKHPAAPVHASFFARVEKLRAQDQIN